MKRLRIIILLFCIAACLSAYKEGEKTYNLTKKESSQIIKLLKSTKLEKNIEGMKMLRDHARGNVKVNGVCRSGKGWLVLDEKMLEAAEKLLQKKNPEIDWAAFTIFTFTDRPRILSHRPKVPATVVGARKQGIGAGLNWWTTF